MELNLQAKMDLQEMCKVHQIAVDDLADIIELNRLADIVSDPKSSSSIAFALLPVQCGNVILHPPRIAALVWHDEHLDWWTQPIIGEIALAYACACEDQAARIAPLVTSEKTFEAINAWAKGVNCTVIDLVTTLGKLLPSSNGKSADKDSHWPVVSLLCREYGATPRYWINEAPIGEIQSLLRDYVDRMDSELKAINRAQKKQIMVIDTTRAEAVKNYREHLNGMKKKWGIANG